MKCKRLESWMDEWMVVVTTNVRGVSLGLFKRALSLSLSLSRHGEDGKLGLTGKLGSAWACVQVDCLLGAWPLIH